MLTATITHVMYLVVLPTGFAWLLWKGRDESKSDWLLKLLGVGTFIWYIFLIGRWPLLSYYLRFAAVGLLVAGGYVSYRRARLLPLVLRRPLRGWIAPGAYSLLFVLSLFRCGQIYQGYFYDDEPVHLTFPLKNGTFYISNGGSNYKVNVHDAGSGQRYALDVNKLNVFGARADRIYTRDLDDYVMFGEAVYSPCAGTAIKAVDGFPDVAPGPFAETANPAGNHIVIRCEGVRVVLAHLKRGSVAAREGEVMAEGQLIGRVGNSGRTTAPHLHVHATRGSDHLGVPILFGGRFLTRNTVVQVGGVANRICPVLPSCASVP